MPIDGRYIKDAMIGSMSGVLVGLGLLGVVVQARGEPEQPTYGDVVKDIMDRGGSFTLYFDQDASFARVACDGEWWEAHASSPDNATYWALEYWLAVKGGAK